MTWGLNKVMLIGNLARDPEMRFTATGKPVTTFSVGTDRTWNTSDGEKHTETEWFNIVVWGSLAEICSQQLSKGSQVFIEGRLQTRKWEDTEGTKHSSIEIIASDMLLLGSRRDNHLNQPGRSTFHGDEIDSDETVD